MDRYSRNISAVSHEENLILQNAKVCVVGCGGLGGYIIEMLGRLGVGFITAVDSDVFEESNLNRQILSEESLIGEKKAFAAKKRMQNVNSNVTVNSVVEYLEESNAENILSGHDLVMDGLDNMDSRLLLERTCKKLNIPMVHGAIAGWYGQMCSIFPGDDTLNKIYSSGLSKGIEKRLGNPAFTPALVASLEVSEAVKILIGRGELLRGKLLFIDVLNHEYVEVDI